MTVNLHLVPKLIHRTATSLTVMSLCLTIIQLYTTCGSYFDQNGRGKAEWIYKNWAMAELAIGLWNLLAD
jgi:hypothetical protein